MRHRVKNLLFLMTPYRLPHHGSRSFTFVQDDVSPSPVILNEGKNALWKRREMER